ncbi:hypothetical protein DPMN_011693 [Dreissena polymorpha]|uniref:MAM domain-containing protein n=1 Tax=Dreissena polymorpha TaxID=45954 RepID=A0A9D4N243_DREPO|nr:hypothetical protein DPMN_011693 [Dreissena polymorpha]
MATAPATLPVGFVCNFDTDVCGWTQDTTDNFDWTRYRGSTTTAGTGPTNDHSGGKEIFFFLFIEMYN